MDAGSTFVAPEVDRHLWVIISDPEQDPASVLIVSLTSFQTYKEQACVLNVGDHPWVRHATCVSYQYAKIVALSSLHTLKDSGKLEMREPVSAKILARIREGAANSIHLALGHAEVLFRQGLIDI